MPGIGDARDRQQPVDAAGGDHQAVVGDVPAVLLGIDAGDAAPVQVDRLGLAQMQPHLRQCRRQRHGHPGGVQQPARYLRQQRQVEEVVGGVDQGDVDVTGGQLAEPAGAVEPGEAGADDDNVSSSHIRSSRWFNLRHSALHTRQYGFQPPK
jgi:hypothetical protein